MPRKWIPEAKVINGSRPDIADNCVKSAARVVQIMEVFDEVRREATVVELCSRLGYPQSSTSALLRTLVKVGFLTYDPYSRTYCPTTRAALLASWVNDQTFGEGVLNRMLNEVARASGEMVLLSARQNMDVKHIHVVQARNRKHIQQTVGAQRRMVSSGAGWTLLSTMTEAEVRRIVHVSNAYQDESEEKVNVSWLIEQLRDIRQKGYCFVPDITKNGGSVIAMPLVVPGRQSQVFAVGIGGPTQVLREREEELAALLRQAIASHFPHLQPDAFLPACAG